MDHSVPEFKRPVPAAAPSVEDASAPQERRSEMRLNPPRNDGGHIQPVPAADRYQARRVACTATRQQAVQATSAWLATPGAA